MVILYCETSYSVNWLLAHSNSNFSMQPTRLVRWWFTGEGVEQTKLIPNERKQCPWCELALWSHSQICVVIRQLYDATVFQMKRGYFSNPKSCHGWNPWGLQSWEDLWGNSSPYWVWSWREWSEIEWGICFIVRSHSHDVTIALFGASVLRTLVQSWLTLKKMNRSQWRIVWQ